MVHFPARFHNMSSLTRILFFSGTRKLAGWRNRRSRELARERMGENRWFPPPPLLPLLSNRLRRRMTLMNHS